MPESDAATFGSELRRLRRSTGLSLSELAIQTNYSKGHLSKVENDLARPNPEMARLCDLALDTGGALAALLSDFDGGGSDSRDHGRLGFGLPRDTANFVGRTEELAQIQAVLAEGSPDDPGVIVVCAVTGIGGVGKTALAIRAAHRLRGAFPDGCLFIDLHGYDGTAVPPREALDRFLRGLRVAPEDIPAHTEDRAALFRDQLTGKGVLLVLDNARDTAQILPLLPASNSCRVLVTSRSRLSSLEDAHRVYLNPLSESESANLVRALAPLGARAERAIDGPDARTIAQWCAGLPLAIRILSARLRTSGPRNVTTAWADGDGPALGDFDDGERRLSSIFQYSYRLLSSPKRRLFAVLALHPGPDFGSEAAAALAGIGPAAAHSQLLALSEAGMVTTDGFGRFGFHDLLRSFAESRAADLFSGPERTELTCQAIDYYLRSTDAADRIITPKRLRTGMTSPGTGVRHRPPDYEQALRWVDGELDNLVAACRAAAALGLHSRCWQLAFALRGFFFVSKKLDLWVETHELAVEAARRAGDPYAEAVTANNLGLGRFDNGEYTAAAEMYDLARKLFVQLGDQRGANTASAHHAWVHFQRGELDEALRESLAALDFIERHGPPRNEAILLRDIAYIELAMRRTDEAVTRLRKALRLFTDLKLHVDTAMALNCLGEALLQGGLLTEATEALLDAVRASRAAGSPFEEARARDGLGSVAAERREWDEAGAQWQLAYAGYAALRKARLAEAVLGRIDSATAATTATTSHL